MAPHSPPEAEAAAVARLQRIVEQLRRRMAFIEGSRFWKLRDSYLKARALAGKSIDGAPPPLPPPDLAEALECDDPYARWLLLNEPRPADLRRLRRFSGHLPKKPRIALCAAGGTIEPQAYPFVDVVTDPAQLLETSAAFVALIGEGETLSAHACAEIALTFNESREAEVIYGDHDRIDGAGHRSAPFFAPAWSPDTLLAYPYLGVAFFRRDLVERLGSFDPELPGAAAAYDLALRAAETTSAFEHCPAMISHRAMPREPAAIAADDYAVSEALERRGLRGRIERIQGLPEARTIRYAIEGTPTVEVIIPTRDHADDLAACLAGVFASAYPNFRVTIVDNGSTEPATHQLFARLEAAHGERMRISRRDEPFNFSRLMNAAAASTDAPYLLLLNNDTEIVSPDWIEAMLEYAQQPAVGAVGARLLYPDSTIQHAGVAIGIGGLAGHPHRDEAPFADPTATLIVRDCSAVTAACLMVRREAFNTAGGFDEELAIEFNDIDFCLKLRKAGLRNVYLPHVVVRHHESRSRGVPTTPAAIRQLNAERERFRDRWGSDEFDDPFYHPALTRLAEDASLAL